MKQLYKMINKRIIVNKFSNTLSVINSDIDLNTFIISKLEWFRFYFPVIGDYLYTIRGFLSKRKKNKGINQMIIIKSIISKERITFTIPLCKTSINKKILN